MIHLLTWFVVCSGGIDVEALATFRQAAQSSKSDVVLIIQNGEVAADWRSEEGKGPIELMSCVKSVVALGIGVALKQGKLSDLDVPVAQFYPAWNQGNKKHISVRHLLNHTSGLQNVPNAGAEIYPSQDVIQLALSAELTSKPGEAFAYNNKAVNLLAGIIEKASGQRMDRFLEDALLSPLDIEEATWYYDPAGNPHAMAGLRLNARDFAKFGELILAKGRWQEQQLIAPEFIEEMLGPGQPHHPTAGLLWWRLPRETRWAFKDNALDILRSKGIEESRLEALKPMLKRTYGKRASLQTILMEALKEDWKKLRAQSAGSPLDFLEREDGPIVAYYAEGYLGNFLVIVPEANLVAVRMAANREDFNHQTDTFPDFPSQIVNLIPSLRAR